MSEKNSIDDYTKRELYELAKEKKVPGRGTMSKPELFEALGLGSGTPAPASPVAEGPGITTAPAAPTSSSTPAAPPSSAPEPGGYVERGAPIPDTYGEDKLTAMVRDPQWIFCYWELEGGGCQRLIDERGQEFMDSAKWIIRVSDLASGARHDIDIDASVRNWYVHVEPQRRYSVEIGVIGPDGGFIPVASAPEVGTPREGLSDEVDEQWMLVREDLEKLIDAMGGVVFGVPGSAMGRRFEMPVKTSVSSSASAASRGARK